MFRGLKIKKCQHKKHVSVDVQPVTEPLKHHSPLPLTVIMVALICIYVFFFNLWLLCIWPISTSPFGRFQVHYRVHSPGKVKRATSCKRKSCALAEVGVKLHRRSSDVGRLCDPGMANKENELTCSDDVRGCGFPVNSAEASKMAGASSKYSDFAEVRHRARATDCFYFIWNMKACWLKTATLKTLSSIFFHCLSIHSYQRTMKLWLRFFLEEVFDLK